MNKIKIFLLISLMLNIFFILSGFVTIKALNELEKRQIDGKAIRKIGYEKIQKVGDKIIINLINDEENKSE